MRTHVKKHKIVLRGVYAFFALLLSNASAGAQMFSDSGPDVTVNAPNFGYRWELPFNANNATYIAQWAGSLYVSVTGDGDHFRPTGATASVRFTDVGSTQVTCCIQGGACNSILARIHPMAPSVSIAPSILCETGQVTISASHPYAISGTNQYRVYTSSEGGSPIATGSSNINISSIYASTTYWVSTYNAIGGESLSRTAVSVSVSTNTVATPGVTQAYGIVGGYATVQASGAGSNVSYRWQHSSGTKITTEDHTTFPTPLASASNFVSVQLDNGVCQGPVAWIPITVYAKPVITGTAIAMGEPATLTGNPDYELYRWYRDGVAVSGTSSENIYSTDIAGVYQVEVFKNGTSGKSDPYTLGFQFDGLDQNYIVTHTVQVKGVTNTAAVNGLTRHSNTQAIQYFDGLGRPMQTVATQGSPSGYDIVQPVVYDAYGRETRKYLPAVPQTRDGRYKAGIVDANGNYAGVAAVNVYNNGVGDKIEDSSQPYAETLLESSPLNRVLKQGAPGAPWQPNASGTYDAPQPGDNSIKKAYVHNGPNEVILLDYDETTKKIGLGNANYYTVNQLQVSKTKDESNHEVMEYVDNNGRTILKKVETVENGLTVYAETYYVYDDSGNLVTVLPPEAMKRVKNMLIQP